MLRVTQVWWVAVGGVCGRGGRWLMLRVTQV